MKKQSLSGYVRQLRIIRALDMLKGVKDAEISEGRSWWICQKWFPCQDKEKYLIQAKGATPAKAARNFLKILPRRIRYEVLPPTP